MSAFFDPNAFFFSKLSNQHIATLPTPAGPLTRPLSRIFDHYLFHPAPNGRPPTLHSYLTSADRYKLAKMRQLEEEALFEAEGLKADGYRKYWQGRAPLPTIHSHTSLKVLGDAGLSGSGDVSLHQAKKLPKLSKEQLQAAGFPTGDGLGKRVDNTVFKQLMERAEPVKRANTKKQGAGYLDDTQRVLEDNTEFAEQDLSGL